MAKGIEFYQKRYGVPVGDYVFGRRKDGDKLHWEKAYGNIKYRCENPKDRKFAYYGGRGIKCRITISNLRDSFILARAWEMEQPSVDRIDVTGDYEPGNIRWIEMRDNRAGRVYMGKNNKNGQSETFKIDSDLMDLIRKFAKQDERTVKATIERVLREKFVNSEIKK